MEWKVDIVGYRLRVESRTARLMEIKPKSQYGLVQFSYFKVSN